MPTTLIWRTIPDGDQDAARKKAQTYTSGSDAARNRPSRNGDESGRVRGVARRLAVNALLQERRPVTVDMAHRLARALKTSPEVWLNMQEAVDIWDALDRYE